MLACSDQPQVVVVSQVQQRVYALWAACFESTHEREVLPLQQADADTSIEGKGIAFEAVQAARRYAYDVLAWDQPVSYIARDNARSMKLAERLGATLDPSAQHPFAHKDILVYRHPKVLP